jgi:small subunit ribosomal protein S11
MLKAMRLFYGARTAARALSTPVDSTRRGVLLVKTSFNNTMVTLTKENGNVLAWASGGSCGFKKSKRKSALAATSALDVIVAKVKSFSLDAIIVRLSGPGKVHRELLTRCAASGVRIDAIQNVTPMAHNGCRQPKARRV